MLINLTYPAVPKGVAITLDSTVDHEHGTIENAKEIMAAFRRNYGPLKGLWKKVQSAISPDVIKSITDKATDAAITGIATEAKKVG